MLDTVLSITNLLLIGVNVHTYYKNKRLTDVLAERSDKLDTLITHNSYVTKVKEENNNLLHKMGKLETHLEAIRAEREEGIMKENKELKSENLVLRKQLNTLGTIVDKIEKSRRGESK